MKSIPDMIRVNEIIKVRKFIKPRDSIWLLLCAIFVYIMLYTKLHCDQNITISEDRSLTVVRDNIWGIDESKVELERKQRAIGNGQLISFIFLLK